MGEGLGPVGRGGYIGENGTTELMYGAVVSEWSVDAYAESLHGQLDVAFTQAPDDAGEQVR